MEQVQEQEKSTRGENVAEAHRWLGDTPAKDSSLVFAVLAVVDELKGIRGEIKRVADNLEGESTSDEKISVGDCTMFIASSIREYVDIQTGKKQAMALQSILSALAGGEQEEDAAQDTE